MKSKASLTYDKGEWRVSDGISSGYGANPHTALAAYKDAKLETEAFYGARLEGKHLASENSDKTISK